MTEEVIRPQLRSDKPRLFNTPFEAGVRATVMLDTVSPAGLNLERLVALDHLVVHTEDLQGPPSFHPSVQTRAAEMLVRRRLIERGIEMMMGRGLIERRPSLGGIEYFAGDEAAIFTHLLCTKYANALKERAGWLKPLALLPEDEFLSIVSCQIETLALQFQRVTPGTKL